MTKLVEQDYLAERWLRPHYQYEDAETRVLLSRLLSRRLGLPNHLRRGNMVQSAPLYQKLKMYGSNLLPYNGEDFYETLSKQEVELILEIYGVYGQFAAWRLREMTHQDPPWRVPRFIKSFLMTL